LRTGDKKQKGKDEHENVAEKSIIIGRLSTTI